MMVGDTKGNTGEQFRCSYHAWTFHHDGASMGGGQIIGEVKAAGGLAQWRAGPVPAQNTMAPAGGHAWRVWTPAAAEAFKRISASAR